MGIPDTPANRKMLGVAPEKKRRGKVELVEEWAAPDQLRPIWVVALETRAEANGRDWRNRNARAGSAWKAVRSVFTLSALAKWELNHRFGEPIYARFTRLGGQRLDPLVNLPSALKGVEDALCYLLGIDDSSPLWKPCCEQVPGGPYGVKIELSTEPFQ